MAPPLRPICVKCQREYKVETGGVALLEHFLTQDGLEPYAIFYADLWECPVCGHQVIGGCGEGAAAHHYEKEKIQHLIDLYREHNKLYHSIPHNAALVE